MKSFWERHKKLHIWFLADACFVAAFFLLRGNRSWMNALANHVTAPLRQAIGRICYQTDISVMEVLGVLLVLASVLYLLWSIVSIQKAKGHRWDRTYSAILGAGCVGLAIYAGFCLLWGVNFWTDSFQDRSGIYAQPVEREDLLAVTAYFARQLALTADEVERDEAGLFAVPREEILAKSPHIYDPLEARMPFLAFDDPGVKPMAFSRLSRATSSKGEASASMVSSISATRMTKGNRNRLSNSFLLGDWDASINSIKITPNLSNTDLLCKHRGQRAQDLSSFPAHRPLPGGFL